MRGSPARSTRVFDALCPRMTRGEACSHFASPSYSRNEGARMTRVGKIGVLLLALLPLPATAAERPEWAFGPEQPNPRQPDDGILKQAPGSAKFYTQAQIDDPMHPPDWFPNEHPSMPRVVAQGNGK